jgi:hypothetical protein
MLRNSFVSDFFIIAFTHYPMKISNASQRNGASVRADPTRFGQTGSRLVMIRGRL